MILKRITRFFCLIMALLATPLISATSATMTLQTANDIFAAGNAFYRAQNYEGAQEAYSELLRAGMDSWPVLYNMGTVEARLGSSTQAMAYLKRAKRLRPRDENIQANLNFVTPKPPESQAEKDQQLDIAKVESLWSRVYGYFTLDEWLAAIWVALLAACVGGAVLFLFKAKKLRAVAGIMVWAGSAFIIITAVPAAFQYYHTNILTRAVVSNPAEMLSGPASRFTRVADLTEGQVVRILDHSTKDFRRIRLENGLEGYVERDALIKL